jgi:hypothetical protein
MKSWISMKKLFLLCFLLYLFLPVKPLHAGQTSTIRSKEVIVLFEDALRGAAEETMLVYPGVKKELEKDLPWPIHFTPTVILKDHHSFQKGAGGDLIVAYAVSGRNLIVIDYSKMRAEPYSLKATLKHELCHLLLHHHIPRGRLPRWLDEGVAQWVSGGMTEVVINRKRSALEGAVLSGRYLRLRSLTKHFPRDEEFLMLAYEQSKSMVEYMIRRYGLSGIFDLMNHLAAGEDIDGALSKSFSISLMALERAWYKDLRKRITWLTYLINHLYEVLFFIAALLMIVGFIRRLLKKKDYPPEDEGDEPPEMPMSMGL